MLKTVFNKKLCLMDFCVPFVIIVTLLLFIYRNDIKAALSGVTGSSETAKMSQEVSMLMKKRLAESSENSA